MLGDFIRVELAQNVLPLHAKAGSLIHSLRRDSELHPRHEVQEPPTENNLLACVELSSLVYI
jgi:hypothetical protein